MSVLANPQTQFDLEAVGKAWTIANQDSYLWPKLPYFLCNDTTTGGSVTTYQLAKLTNALQEGPLVDWEPGMSLPTNKVIGSDTVTVTCTGKSTKVNQRPLKRSGPHIFEDLESNIVPSALAQLYQGIDVALMAFLTSSAYGSQKTFTGNSALDAASDYANQDPLRDFRTNLAPLLKYRGDGRVLAAILDVETANMLAGHPAFVGGGTGSAIPSHIAPSEVANILRSRLSLDEVIILGDSHYSSARPGQTAVITSTTRALCWMGIIDRSGSGKDLRGNSFASVDGGLAIGFGRMPEVVNFQDAASEMDNFVGRTSFGIINPRSASANNYFGHFYKKTGSNGLFTS